MKESCKHTFIGKADGVHCTKCGVSMTTEAYRAYLAPRQTPKKKAVENVPHAGRRAGHCAHDDGQPRGEHYTAAGNVA